MMSFIERLSVPLKWLWSIQDPSLEEDETVRLEGFATSLRGVLAPDGRLLLTSRRLIFIPSRLAFFPRSLWPTGLDLPLASIESVELAGAILPQFIVNLRSGRVLKFQIINAKAWQKEITSRITLPDRI